MGKKVRGESSTLASERARMDGGRVDITSESEGLPGFALVLGLKGKTGISGCLDGGFACWFVGFGATAGMAASNWKMHWLEAAVVESYYSAPRRTTVDASTLLRFCLCLCLAVDLQAEGFKSTVDLRLSASTAELWQLHTIGSQGHGPRPHWQRKGSAHPNSHSVFSRGHDADTMRLNPAPQASYISLSNDNHLSHCGVSATSPSVQPERLKMQLPFLSECPKSNNGIHLH